MDEDLDCQTCGACCVNPRESDTYLLLDRADVRRLRRHRLPVVRAEEAEGLAELGTKTNAQGLCVCVALRGRVGRRCACTVYRDRPHACREFRAGSAECLRARREAGVGPQP
jgi:Fe-S-cluster containining protein